MTATSRPLGAFCAVLGLVLYLDCASTQAGEGPQVVSTNPILYYACLADGGSVEYDSAAFATKNPGPTYPDHSRHTQRMQDAFKDYLAQTYGFPGYVTCGQHNTLAEAKKWLAWRKEYQVGRNYQLVTTDWAYSGTVSASAAPPPPAAPPAAATSPTTAYYVCTAMTKDAAYDNEPFAASSDFGTNRRVYFSFGQFAAERFGNLGVGHSCVQKLTLADAQKYQQQIATAGNLPRSVTHWVYTAPKSP